MPSRDGAWIRAWRRRNGYSQEELAFELGVSRQTIAGWEKSIGVERLVALSLVALELNPVEQICLARGSRRRRGL